MVGKFEARLGGLFALQPIVLPKPAKSPGKLLVAIHSAPADSRVPSAVAPIASISLFDMISDNEDPARGGNADTSRVESTQRSSYSPSITPVAFGGGLKPVSR